MNDKLIENIRLASLTPNKKYLFVDKETYSEIIDYYVETYYDASEKDRLAIKNVMKNEKYKNELELYKLKVVRVIDKLTEGFFIA